MSEPDPGRGARPVDAILAAWLLTLGFDLFLHAGLLARLYARPSEFLLPAEAAFQRIPLGYLSFLALTGVLYWLYDRLDVRGFGAGLRHGLAVGVILWGIWIVGLYSISTAEADLLVGWWLGQAAELGLAGAVLGAGRKGIAKGRLYGRVAVAIVVLAVATFALQAVGLAPAMRTV